VDERRKHERATSKATPTIIWLVLDDGTKQMGVIDDHGAGGACIELNGVVREIAAGNVVGLEFHTAPQISSGNVVPQQGRIAWVTRRHLGLQYLGSATDDT
jgi:hypothetical protein